MTDFEVKMKKINFGKSAGKILFAVCCVIFAFVFWFIIKFNNLAGVPLELLKYC